MLDGDVTNELHQGYCLAHTGAAEQADFSAPCDGHDQVDHLDAGFQRLVSTCLFFIGRRFAVDRHTFFFSDRTGLVNRPPQHIHHAAEGLLAHGDRDGCTRVADREAALQAVGGSQRNAAHYAIAQLLLHFQRDFGVIDRQGVEYPGHGIACKLHVNNGTDYLNN